MSRDHDATEKAMEKQSIVREREKQYNILTGLGWKSAGLLFLVLVIAILVYATFFR